MFGSTMRYVEQFNGSSHVARTIDGLAKTYRGHWLKPGKVLVVVSTPEAQSDYQRYAQETYPDIPFEISLTQ